MIYNTTIPIVLGYETFSQTQEVMDDGIPDAQRMRHATGGVNAVVHVSRRLMAAHWGCYRTCILLGKL